MLSAEIASNELHITYFLADEGRVHVFSQDCIQRIAHHLLAGR